LCRRFERGRRVTTTDAQWLTLEASGLTEAFTQMAAPAEMLMGCTQER
jgi:hypothetical protein